MLASGGAFLMMLGFLLSAGGGMTVESAPPVVIRTVPESGAVSVDPKTAEVRVTFSKAMMDGAWSWVKTPEAAFPEMVGKPRYEKDGRTCVLPVKLQPGKTYALWVNSSSAANFRDAAGRSAVPYLLVFNTQR